MRIEVPTILYWLFPVLKERSPAAREALLDAARRRSVQRVRRYGGWCWLVSLVLPFVVLFPMFAWADCVEQGRYLVGMPVLIVCSVLASSFLHSLLQVLLLKPAIRALLQEEDDHNHPS